MGPWFGAVIYGVLVAIVVTVVSTMTYYHRKAKRHYAEKAKQWENEGYRRAAGSPAGAALFCHDERRSLIVARENTDRFTVFSYEEICGFSLYDDDYLILSADVGGEVQKGDPREEAKKAKRRKSECFRLVLRCAGGENYVVALTQDLVLRESREYDETQKMAEKFADLMLAVKAENEREQKTVPPPTESKKEPDGNAGAEARLAQLRDLCDKGLISKEQYAARSAEIIKNI